MPVFGARLGFFFLGFTSSSPPDISGLSLTGFTAVALRLGAILPDTKAPDNRAP